MIQVKRDKSKQSKKGTPWALAVFRSVGYSLLVLALIDLIAIFVPLRFMNPLWQFETMGAIIERVLIPLLGLVLVSLGQEEFRSPIEQKLLKTLRWLCLPVGVLFLLLIPLLFIDTLQVRAINNTQMSDQYNQQKAQIAKVEQQLNQLKDQELENFIKSQGRTLDSQIPQQAKQQFLAEINRDKQQMPIQFEEAKANRRMALFKSSLKWSLGALVAGILFINIWHLTRWAL
jgi:cell division protein FtsB